MLPLQSADALKEFDLTEEQALQQLWALDARGRRLGGAEAANVALAAAIRCSVLLWLYRLPGMRWCQDRLYRAVAANRYRLPGRGGSCAVDG